MIEVAADSLEDIKRRCDELRANLLVIERAVRALAGESQKDQPLTWESRAQAVLAVRHIEDARMRIGKVIQYAGDGVSIYDKPGLGI